MREVIPHNSPTVSHYLVTIAAHWRHSALVFFTGFVWGLLISVSLLIIRLSAKI